MNNTSDHDTAVSPIEHNPSLSNAVIVGVVPDMPERLLTTAREYARVLQAPLVALYCSEDDFETGQTDTQGEPAIAAIDINIGANERQQLDAFRASIEVQLSPHPYGWEFTQATGSPIKAFRSLAKKIDAQLIVVGTRKHTFGDSVREFFDGSVAAALSHHQHLPILIVPQDGK